MYYMQKFNERSCQLYFMSNMVVLKLHPRGVLLFQIIRKNILFSCNYGEKKHSFSAINRFLKNKIEEYQIKCKYHEQGCLKVLKIALIEKHEEKCEFSLQKEKSSLNCEFSTLSSTNCPTSIFKCPTCKKQMLMPEVK